MNRHLFQAAVGVGGWLAFALLAHGQEAGKTAKPATSETKGGATTIGTRPEGPSVDVRIQYWDPKEAMEKGGFLMWPILGCSIITITFGLERLISLRRSRVIPNRFVKRLFQGLRSGELGRNAALESCQQNGSPMAEVCSAALRRWGQPSSEIQLAIDETGGREVTRLRRNLRTLNAVSNVATLLGLLGTIFGMIDAFNNIASYRGMGRAEVLASGIAQALLTTAFGLLVAIPAVILYNYFAGKVDRLVYDMDLIASDLTGIVSAEAQRAHATEQPARVLQREAQPPVVKRPAPNPGEPKRQGAS